MNKEKAKTIQTRLEWTEEEHAAIKRKAAEQNIPLTKFLKKKGLDDSAGVDELKSEILKLMPGFHVLIEQIEDRQLKEAMMKVRRELCQRLK